jgi:hypothetical protein
MVLHPDKVHGQHWLQRWWGGDAAHRFSRLAAAHECLADAECRAGYDDELRGHAAHAQLHWSQRWAAAQQAQSAQWVRAWGAVESPRELGLYVLASVQALLIELPQWLPSMLVRYQPARSTGPAWQHPPPVQQWLHPLARSPWLSDTSRLRCRCCAAVPRARQTPRGLMRAVLTMLICTLAWEVALRECQTELSPFVLLDI